MRHNPLLCLLLYRNHLFFGQFLWLSYAGSYLLFLRFVCRFYCLQGFRFMRFLEAFFQVIRTAIRKFGKSEPKIIPPAVPARHSLAAARKAFHFPEGFRALPETFPSKPAPESSLRSPLHEVQSALHAHRLSGNMPSYFPPQKQAENCLPGRPDFLAVKRQGCGTSPKAAALPAPMDRFLD